MELVLSTQVRRSPHVLEGMILASFRYYLT